MLLSPGSIGSKLLYSFIAITLLMILASTIGVAGFSFVAKTERRVVNQAIPSMIEARQVSELSARIISTSQRFAGAQTEAESKAAGTELFRQLDALLNHIRALGSDSFDPALLDQLEQNVQDIIDNFAGLGMSVDQRLKLTGLIIATAESMQEKANELEGLTRTQVLNASTVTVANITHMYDLLESNDKEAVYDNLDSLIEVDLDLSERLHELHLLAFRLLTQIEEAKTVTDFERIRTLQQQFEQNLTIMARRVRSVEDPSRSEKMTALIGELQERSVLFDWLAQRYENGQSTMLLNEKTSQHFAGLNQIVSRLIDDSNRGTAQAVSQVIRTLTYAQWTLMVISVLGLAVVTIIVWRVVYLRVVARLSEYSGALRGIAKGDLEVDVRVEGDDEMASMGRAIINARDTAKTLQVVAQRERDAKSELEQHKEHLEELVDERTHQLRETNDKLNVEVLNHARARNQAEQANRAKSAFLATISHEIRTPMNGVLGMARLLKESGLNAAQSGYVDIIGRSGTHLLSIINDVLDYSKIEAGHLKISPESFDLPQLVEETCALHQVKAQEKGLALYVQIEPGVGHFKLGDATRIAQLLTNLVGNAIKFTPEGEVDVYVCADPDKAGHILFEVRDTGTGIAKEEQGSLFEAFTQATDGRHTPGGTGLGLAICKRIADAMGGTIGLSSEPGEGSRFWFSLPLEDGKEVSQPLPVLEKCRAARVLLVEDNPVNCLVAEGFLQSLGHTAVTATSCAQAREVFARETFDLALLDINLPDGDGVELQRSLRNMEGDAVTKTPMVAVSAHVFAEEVSEYLRSGFDGFLPKPVEKEELAAVLAAHLGGEASPAGFGSRPEVVPADSSESLDLSVLRQDLDVLGEEKLKQLITLFKQSSDEIWREWQSALRRGDSALVKSMAHKLKGSAAGMGLRALQTACQSIEAADSPLQAAKENEKQMTELLSEACLALDDFTRNNL